MRKKKSTKPEMGYYPFEHWLSKTRRRALGRRRWGAGARARGREGRAFVRGSREWKERVGRARQAG